MATAFGWFQSQRHASRNRLTQATKSLLQNSRFVSGHRFSDVVSGSEFNPFRGWVSRESDRKLEGPISRGGLSSCGDLRANFKGGRAMANPFDLKTALMARHAQHVVL